MTLNRASLANAAKIVACVVLMHSGACTLPDEPVLDNPIDPTSFKYIPRPPVISWISQNSQNGCWLVVSVIEPYVSTVHIERRGGTARDFREILSIPNPGVHGFWDTTSVLIVDSVYTYRARIKAIGGAFSTYSPEIAFKARVYPS